MGTEIVGHIACCPDCGWTDESRSNTADMRLSQEDRIEEHTYRTGHRLADIRAKFSDGTVYNSP
jgi:hypothetical protein